MDFLFLKRPCFKQQSSTNTNDLFEDTHYCIVFFSVGLKLVLYYFHPVILWVLNMIHSSSTNLSDLPLPFSQSLPLLGTLFQSCF